MRGLGRKIIALVIIMFVFQVNSSVFAEETLSNNQLIIKYKDENEAKLTNKEKNKLDISSEDSEKGHELVEVQKDNKEEIIKKLESNENVEYVVENTMYQIADEPINLADPYMSKQWNLKAINAPKLWSTVQSYKKTKVKVAVIDTGVSSQHADLKGRVGKGQTFLNSSNDGVSGLAEDDHGHGTFIAGIIAANTNNQLGVASVTGNANVEILPIKVMNSSGGGDTAFIAKGINYAVDQGADIINLSISGEPNIFLEDAIADATKNGVLVVAAAGNGGENADLYYPGALNQVISVGSTTSSNRVYSGSNRGSTVDLVAPGVGLISTSIDKENLGNLNFYISGRGTSYATPHVTAIAAMYKLKYPDATAKEIRTALENTSTDIGEKGKDKLAGNGLVNAQAALAFKPVRTIPKIKTVSISNNSTKVIVKTEKLAQVAFKVEGKTYNKKASSSGTATITIKKPKAGSVWQATAINLGGNKHKLSGKVADRVAPKITSVSAANNSTKVTVKTEKKAKITLKINGKTYSKTANSSGEAVFNVSKPSAGKKWTVSAADAAENKANLSGTVKDRVAPKAVKVSTKIKTSTTKINGIAEKSSTITVYKNSKKYKTVKAASSGKFKVSISKQKKNTKLSFYAKDKSGNQSKGLKVTIK